MEKFALLNLLQALQKMSAGQDGDSAVTEAETHAAANPSSSPAYAAQTAQNNTEYVQKVEIPNVWTDVLSRHETISNRVKNKK